MFTSPESSPGDDGRKSDMSVTEHTFTAVLRPADGWIESDTWQLVCTCGIASGMSHPTREDALREPRHWRHARSAR